jgi:hypothetical protein
MTVLQQPYDKAISTPFAKSAPILRMAPLPLTAVDPACARSPLRPRDVEAPTIRPVERPNSGGRRPGSGRKKGTPNKVTVEIKELAQKYGPDAIAKLARLATKAESVAAIKELLDRGYGRAVQPIRQHDVRCE